MHSPQLCSADVLPYDNSVEHHEQNQVEPIAIIGYAGRFPQAESATEFWHNMIKAIDGVGDIPPERWDGNAYFDKRPATAYRSYCNRGGFLHNIDAFDNIFFSISEDEARCMDPKQRLLIQTVYHGLEHAGYGGEAFCGTDTGVFIGSSYYHHEHEMPAHKVVSPFGMLGTNNTLLSNRISHMFNFKGPSIYIDTFCSSSLMAVHLACQSLKQGECHTALAGGVHLLSLIHFISLSQFRALSAAGRCRPFDQDADGFVPGEGVGIVVLKPLKAALKDRDTIHAIINGAAINHTGRTNSLTSPSAESQSRLIEAAYKNAGVDFNDISYIETHGTGTKLGDPLEIKALKNAFKQKTNRHHRCVLGSVKSSIGHLEPASGIASLIKVLLCLKHKQIPGVLHLNQVNRFISLKGSPFEINTQTIDWTTFDKPRRAGISSFGLSGTNVHMVVEEFTAKRKSPKSVPLNKVGLFTLSAMDEKGLRKLSGQTADMLNSYSDKDLDDICYTQAVGRQHFNLRTSILFDGIEDLKNQLNDLAQSQDIDDFRKKGVIKKKSTDVAPEMTLVFAQNLETVVPYVTLLWHYKTFRQIFKKTMTKIYECLTLNELALKEHWQCDPVQITEMAPHVELAAAVAIYQLFRSWGLEPSVITGNGLGIIAAALAANAISWETALFLKKNMRKCEATCAKMTIEFSPDIVFVPFSHWETRQGLAVGDQIALVSNINSLINGEQTELAKRSLSVTSMILWFGDHLLPSFAQNNKLVHFSSTWHGICRGIGQLYNQGVRLNWREFYQPVTANRVPLPNYPFESTRINFNENQRPTIMNLILNPIATIKPFVQSRGLQKTEKVKARALDMDTTDKVTDYLLRSIERKVGIDETLFNTDTGFEEIGMDSIMKVELSYEIMERFPELEQAGNALIEAQRVNEFIEIINGYIKSESSLPKEDAQPHSSFLNLETLHASQKTRSENLACRSCRIESQTLTADLSVNEQHPFFFDHPLDHVSGIHQLEAMIQAVTTAHQVMEGKNTIVPLFFKDIHVDFKHICPKYGSSQIVAHQLEFTEGCNESTFYIATIGNGEKDYCKAFFKVQPGDKASNAIFKPSKATSSEDIRFTACAQNKVHKNEMMNVLISDMAKPYNGMKEMTFDLRPVGDHPYFSDYRGEYIPSIYFLETFRQTQRYLQQLQHDETNNKETKLSYLLSLTLSLYRPVGCHEPVKIEIDKVQPKSVGRSLVVNACGRLFQGRTTLGFCKNQNMVLKTK